MNHNLELYIEMFGDLPRIPMMQCSGINDEDYIAMCEDAVKRGTPVTDEDYDKYFPIEDGAIY